MAVTTLQHRYLVPDPGTEFCESESNLQKAFRLDTLLTARGAIGDSHTVHERLSDDDDPISRPASRLPMRTTSIGFTPYTVMPPTALRTIRSFWCGKAQQRPVSRNRRRRWRWRQLISPKIYAVLRTPACYTRLDYAFLGFRLGVLNGLLMPGELSEGSFHDVPAETRRLMNKLYKKIEAYALRNSFMSYFSVPPDSLGIIAGIQSDLVTSKGVNFSRVRLLPLDRVVTGDLLQQRFLHVRQSSRRDLHPPL